jgi:hypothetical protein
VNLYWRKNRKTFYIASIILVAIIFLLLPLEVPYSINVLGKILTEKEWMLKKLRDGSIMAVLNNYKNNVIASYEILQVERGDILKFSFKPDIVRVDYVSEGDTIGHVYSNEIHRNLAVLNRDLVTAVEELRVNTTGEKESIINEARKSWQLAKERVKVQNKILNRQKELIEKSLISQEEYEIEEGTANIYTLEAAVAEARLHTLETGAKPEEIAALHARITSIHEEIAIMKERLDHLTLITPLSGRLFKYFATNDTLVIVGTNSYVVVMPISWKFINEIKEGQTVKFEIPGQEEQFSGKVEQINQIAQILNGEQVFMVIASIDPTPEHLVKDLIIHCVIEGNTISPGSYVKRLISIILS